MNPDISISSAVLPTALYFGTAIGLVLLAQRFVRRISRVAVIVILLLPLCFTGRALLTGRVYSPIDLPFQDQPLESFRDDFGIGRIHNGILSDVFTLNIPWKYAARLAITHFTFLQAEILHLVQDDNPGEAGPILASNTIN